MAKCFSNYRKCVLHNDYWDIFADSDCAVTLAGCVRGAVFKRAAKSKVKAKAKQARALAQKIRKSVPEAKSLKDAVRIADLDKTLDKAISSFVDSL
jgi:hypothetical protein